MKSIKFFIACMLVAATGGCNSYGTKMDKTEIDQIKKGVTTRAEVDQKLGPPATVVITSTGDREAHYIYAETDTNATTFIPYVNLFTSGAKHRQQNLVVIYTPDNIVKDYDFTDAQGTTSGGGYNSHTGWSATPDSSR